MNRSTSLGIHPSLLRPLGRLQASTAAMSKPNPNFTTSCTFVEDFNMEHSSAGRSVSRLTLEPSAQRSTAPTASSPNCVYLG